MIETHCDCESYFLKAAASKDLFNGNRMYKDTNSENELIHDSEIYPARKTRRCGTGKIKTTQLDYDPDFDFECDYDENLPLGVSWKDLE